MAYDFTPVIHFLEHVFQRFRADHPKLGKPYTYSEVGMIILFMTMFVKRIFTFKGMARYAAEHYRRLEFKTAPSRQTIRRRFSAFPRLLQQVIPMVADEAVPLDSRFASGGIGCIAKGLFWAKGGVWHTKQRNAGVVPTPTIDTEASWGFPPYRKRGIFGDGFHAIVNRVRFPLSAWVTTGSANDDRQVRTLLSSLPQAVLLLVGDQGYRIIKTIQAVFKEFHTFIVTRKPYTCLADTFTRWYSAIIASEEALGVYWQRKTSVEPCFSLIKELFDLTDRQPLPYKGLQKNQSFLFMAVLTIQCLMIFHSMYRLRLRSLSTFKTLII